MHLPDPADGTAVAVMPAKGGAVAPGYFAHPDPVGPPVIPATTVPADFLNTMAEEGRRVVIAAGMALNKAVDYQIRDAVFGMVGGATARVIPGVEFHWSGGATLTARNGNADPTNAVTGQLGINSNGVAHYLYAQIPYLINGLNFSACAINLSSLTAGNLRAAVIRKVHTTGVCTNLSTVTPTQGEALGAGITSLTLDTNLTVNVGTYSYFVWIVADGTAQAALESVRIQLDAVA